MLLFVLLMMMMMMMFVMMMMMMCVMMMMFTAAKQHWAAPGSIPASQFKDRFQGTGDGYIEDDSD